MRNDPFNSLLRKWVVSRYEVANGVYFRSNKPDFKLRHDEPFFFDFRDPRYIHFGDMLFFVPLLLCLSRNFQIVCLANGPHKALLDFMLPSPDYKISVVEDPPWSTGKDQGSRGVVITTPYLLTTTIYPSGFAIIGLGLLSTPTHQPYPEFLASAFLQFAKEIGWSCEELSALTGAWSHELKQRIEREAIQRDLSLPDHCIWLAPYLGSGRFRDFLKTKQRNLLSTAAEMAEHDGATLILVGGRNDPPIQIEKARLLDLRGNDIVHMVCLAGSNKVRQGIGFDGFWMHIFDILGKRFDVLFRGRLTRRGRDLHYQSVNVSFLGSGERKYL